MPSKMHGISGGGECHAPGVLLAACMQGMEMVNTTVDGWPHVTCRQPDPSSTKWYLRLYYIWIIAALVSAALMTALIW